MSQDLQSEIQQQSDLPTSKFIKFIAVFNFFPFSTFPIFIVWRWWNHFAVFSRHPISGGAEKITKNIDDGAVIGCCCYRYF